MISYPLFMQKANERKSTITQFSSENQNMRDYVDSKYGEISRQKGVLPGYFGETKMNSIFGRFFRKP